MTGGCRGDRREVTRVIAQLAIRNNTAIIGRARWAHKMFVATLLALVSTPSDPLPMPQPLTLAVHSNAPTPLPEGRFIPQGVYGRVAKYHN